MPQALPLSTKISQSSSASVEYAVDKVQYGNGYEQTAKKGINNVKESWAITWDSLSLSEYTTLKTAFDSYAGTDYFTWTAPGGTSKKYLVESVSSISAISGDYYVMSVTLKQVYRL